MSDGALHVRGGALVTRGGAVQLQSDTADACCGEPEIVGCARFGLGGEPGNTANLFWYEDETTRARCASGLIRWRSPTSSPGGSSRAFWRVSNWSLGAAWQVFQSNGRYLRQQHDQQELAFRGLIEQHAAAQQQATERTRLERTRNKLLEHQASQAELIKQRDALQRAREQLLERLAELRDQRFAIRRQVAGRITTQLDGRVRVSVQQAGDKRAYAELLSGALRNARVRIAAVAKKLAATFWPDQLAALAQAGDPKPLVDEAELNPQQARKVIAALAEQATLFQLESVDLGDLPRIELNDNGDYKPSAALSTGQKCTTVLPILLLDSDRPLLIDQPEDNLDNRFIFEHVVESVRHMKRRRQLVLVTYNPNIPVLGDAERVFVLDSDGTHAGVMQQGSVDNCRGEILTLLEGGAQAFNQRQIRYRGAQGHAA